MKCLTNINPKNMMSKNLNEGLKLLLHDKVSLIYQQNEEN